MVRVIRSRRISTRRGQALAEFALIAPIALLTLFAVIVLGLFIFYQQQLTNVTREAARFAAIHSSTSLCPTASWRDPQAPLNTYSRYPFHCDGPNRPGDAYPWPEMTGHARGNAWGLDRTALHINACWSGYLPPGTPPGSTNADFPSVELDPVSGFERQNTFAQCTIAGVSPITNSNALDCRTRMTTAADDPASDVPGNQVTVYGCFTWRPPLSGILFLPAQVTMRSVITEVIQRQQ